MPTVSGLCLGGIGTVCMFSAGTTTAGALPLQGDREKELGLPVSPLFDRDKPGVTKSQVG